MLAQIGVQTNRGRQFRYRQAVRADTTGRYALRLPYASDTATTSGNEWHVGSRGEEHVLNVSEAAVREGRPIVGPNFGSTSALR